MAATVTSTSYGNVKVVIIDTRYVETEPHNFKSVVQRLTGKDCCVSWIEESSFSCRKTETKNVAAKIAAEGSYDTATVGSGYGGGGHNDSMLTEGLNFNELDWMILETPPLEELSWLWDE